MKRMTKEFKFLKQMFKAIPGLELILVSCRILNGSKQSISLSLADNRHSKDQGVLLKIVSDTREKLDALLHIQNSVNLYLLV